MSSTLEVANLFRIVIDHAGSKGFRCFLLGFSKAKLEVKTLDLAMPRGPIVLLPFKQE